MFVIVVIDPCNNVEQLAASGVDTWEATSPSFAMSQCLPARMISTTKVKQSGNKL